MVDASSAEDTVCRVTHTDPASFAASAPTITATALIEHLVSSGVLDGARIIGLLGAKRHGVVLDTLEMELVKANIMSPLSIAKAKGVVSGRPTVDTDTVTAAPVLPAPIARAAGALVLDTPEPTVAFIEDLPNNIERVAQVTGRDDFAIWLMSAPQFAEMYKAAYTGSTKEARPPTKDIFEVFDECVTADASDIHLSVGEPPVLRVNGDLVPLHRQPLDQEWMRTQVVTLLGEDALKQVLADYNRDAGFSYGSVRFRINIGCDVSGITFAIRKLPSKIPKFDDLGLPAAVRKFCDLERGLVLVTGPTGSGKSTTLAAIISHIANTQSRHILTMEDPIEFVFSGKRSMVHQRELNESFSSFGAALKQSLRQDPDVILVGEARDRETIGAAVTAAETGALVFATLHTYDAASTLGRIVSVYPEGEQDQIRNQLAYVLKGVVSQTLVPAIAGGRVAALEVLVSTAGVANNLRKVDGIMQLRQVLVTGQSHGMQTMEMHLAALVRRGLVREIDAEYKARDIEEFRRHLQSNPLDDALA